MELIKTSFFKKRNNEKNNEVEYENNTNYNLQRYKNKDGYIVCGQCESKIGCENICGDCFCQNCLEFNDECNCC